jgi:hypothetical protein
MNEDNLTLEARLKVQELQADIDRIAALDKERAPILTPEEAAEIKLHEDWLKKYSPKLVECNALLETSKNRMKELEVNGSHIYFSGKATPQEIAAEFNSLVELVEFLEMSSRAYSRERGQVLARIEHTKIMAREREIQEQKEQHAA